MGVGPGGAAPLPCPSPNSPAPPRRGPQRSWPHPLGSGSAGLGGRHARHAKARGRPGAVPGYRLKRPLSCPRRSAPTAPQPGRRPAGNPTRSAVLTEASGTATDGRNPELAALEIDAPSANPPALLPSAGRLSGRLAALAETAKAYARSAQADNTQRAYAADWRQFASWLRRQGLAETPPDPEAVGLYLAAQVERRGAELSVATLERRLSGIAWRYRQLGRSAWTSVTGISRLCSPASAAARPPPLQKAAIFANELLAMLATRDMDWGPARPGDPSDRLRRRPPPLEIVGLDCGPGQTEDGSGWIEIFPEGALLTIRGKTGWREVEIGRGSRADTCPVALLESRMRLGHIGHGGLFRAIARKNGGVSGARLTGSTSCGW